MATKQKRLVFGSYDRMADAYLSKYEVSSVRQKWLRRLIEGLPNPGAAILDLGCGAGRPVALQLTSLGHFVFGVDGSAEQIARARANVPEAEFVVADMTEIELEPGRFDAVSAFYSITHIPAREQGMLFRHIVRWLKLGGIFVASLGTGKGGDWSGEWLGQPMFFNHNSERKSLALLEKAGLTILQTAVEKQDNEDTSFLWILAAKR